MNKREAVLLLAYGTPDKVEAIAEFLADINGAKEAVSQELLDDCIRRYQAIGGQSPLLKITQSLAQKLKENIGRNVYVAMRHFHPRIEDVVSEMSRDCVHSAHVICMTPYYSPMSVGAYEKQLLNANQKSTRPIQFQFHKQWFDVPQYYESMAKRIRNVMPSEAGIVMNANSPSDASLRGRNNLHSREHATHPFLLYTAHSLPDLPMQKIYVEQLKWFQNKLNDFLDWPLEYQGFCFQSAPVEAKGWLGPSIEETISELHRQGKKQIIVAPIGFICEHIEVLYDIDIAAKKLAQELGIQLHRVKLLDDSDDMLNILQNVLDLNSWKNNEN